MWVYAKYIKDKSFWDIKILAIASWGWRLILSLRSRALPFIRHLIGNGTSTLLWTDPWMESGCLVDQYAMRPSYDLGLGLNILVSNFIHDGTSHFPVRRSAALLDILRHITTEVYPATNYPNEIIWTLEDCGKFSLKSAYNMIANHDGIPAPWTNLIWFKGRIKKHFICSWMVMT